MKLTIASSMLAAASVLATPLTHAQGMGGMEMKGMDMKSEKKAKSQEHKGSGTVSKVDSAMGTVTIAHGPVESMKWPAMNMTFKAKDKALLETVKPGAKVDFTFMQSGKDYVITSIK